MAAKAVSKWQASCFWGTAGHLYAAKAPLFRDSLGVNWMAVPVGWVAVVLLDGCDFYCDFPQWLLVRIWQTLIAASENRPVV